MNYKVLKGKEDNEIFLMTDRFEEETLLFDFFKTFERKEKINK